MRVRLESIIVDDQAKALKFYTEKLGFKVKTDIPAGGARWITVVPPDEPDGPELLLEPIGMDFAKTFQQALYEKGIPLTMLASDSVQEEYEELKAKGVAFKMPPTQSPGGGPMIAIFDDTCGNYIMMYEIKKK
ncbi:MAG: VOC family protein [Rhizobiales bacterium]|jgi:catechol 2,3-dioxygenase-like lactoylglutathione lyase family enzyme|nr:VOC family protein [Hyphomicrobiales bacterium]